MKQDERLMSSRKKLVFLFLAILFSLENENSVFVLVGASNDTLHPGHSLALGETLVSKNGVFQLGFISYKFEIYHLAISLLDDIVWQESYRDTSMSHPILSLSRNGDLVLVDQDDGSKIIIWSSNEPGGETVVSPYLVLLDTGNLVLRERDNSSKIIWQSFDHPTNTWFPGARLGLNLSLIYLDYHNASFSLEIDPSKTHGFIIRQNSNDFAYHGVFPDWMDIREDGDHFVTFYNTKEYPNLYVQLFPWLISLHQWVNESNKSRAIWSEPNGLCDIDSVCGPYSLCKQSQDVTISYCSCLDGFQPKDEENWDQEIYKDGCTRSISISCEIKNDNHVDSFYSVNNIIKFPNNSQSLAVKTEEDCKASCFSNCSCTAFSYTNSNCNLWFGELFNAIVTYYDWGENVINIKRMDYKNKSPTFRTTIIMLISGFVIISIVVLLIICLYKRRGFLKSSNVNNFLVLYSYAQIKSITTKFSQKIGEGGFGSVFKGKLPDSGVLVAAKKLKTIHYEEKQFKSEIQTIGIIHHVNLVKLLGFCAEGTERLLVYEYMPNGSLDSHLFSNNFVFLTWNTRYQIALGIARGLAYLHDECRDCIIHCDIKPENILLDEKFCPKIADFGMAKLLGREFSRALTTMRGTIGYLAPEWISGQPITQKADVYSFGMMLFEIISGRRNVEKLNNGECTYFPLYAAININHGDVLKLLDEKLKGIGNMDELDKACKVACWCIQDFENDRPSMKQVVQMLEGFLKIEMPPAPRRLQNLVDIESDSI